MEINRYTNQFIKLCSMLCTIRDDYGSKKKVSNHNKAAKKIFTMREYFKNNIDIAIPVYEQLLRNEDSNVKIQAAAHCLYLKIHVDEAIKILKKESKRKDIDKSLVFNAEMCLEIYKRKVSGKNI